MFLVEKKDILSDPDRIICVDIMPSMELDPKKVIYIDHHPSPLENDDNHLMYMSRLQWNFMGRKLKFSGSDIEFHERFTGLLAIGARLSLQLRPGIEPVNDFFTKLSRFIQ